jgi:LmbE family N-acetylglucosaminyl deacetylase
MAANVIGRNMNIDFPSFMFLAPHPDDEILGCGGLITQCAGTDRECLILFLTKGETSHHRCCAVSEDLVGSTRRALALSANAALGISGDRLQFLDGKDGHLPRRGEKGFFEFAEKVADRIECCRPDAIFCPHPFEGWPDHMAAEELTWAAINRLSYEPQLFYYCVWFWYGMPLHRAWHVKWRNARLLDITGQLSLKKRAVNIYLQAKTPCGAPWVGKLPPEFLRAFDWGKELFFKADRPLAALVRQ